MTAASTWDAAEIDRARGLAARLQALAPRSGRMIAARAPGRVNLIGEHTDYSGLPVLPIAIDRSTMIVAAPRDDTLVEVHNVDPAYPPRSFALRPEIAPFAAADWGNYLKAAAQGLISHLSAGATGAAKLRGATMIVDGRVPVAAGLSSSAALTVATTLALLSLAELQISPLEIAAMTARSEWYVGTMAGGMDQAASLLGQPDHALHIRFRPLRVEPVPMPSEAAVVVADSLEVADKSGKVRDEYNRRVVECALAARLLGHALRLKQTRVLGDILAQLGGWETKTLLRPLAAIARTSPNLFEAAKTLDVDRDILASELLGSGSSEIALDHSRPLELLRRARHVLTEADRVEAAVAALANGRLEEMGALMNESHRSLAEDFEVSTPRLGALVECARRGGALGARLTGAGFGGSIVALCRMHDADRVITEIERGYYESFAGTGERRDHIAVLRAGAGASVIEL